MLQANFHQPVGFFSYLFATVAFVALTIILASDWKKKFIGGMLIAASVGSIIWAVISTIFAYKVFPTPSLLIVSEIIRHVLWISFLLSLTLQNEVNTNLKSLLSNRLYVLVIATGVAAIFLSFYSVNLLIIYLIILTVTGLYLVEGLVSGNSTANSNIRHLSIALISIFLFDFLFYSYSLLFRNISIQAWQARGAINGAVVPLIALSVIKNPEWSLRPHVSRKFMFNSISIIGVGIYLLISALAGYYIKYFGGTWGSIFQIIILSLSTILLCTTIVSSRFRAHFKVFLTKHFYNNKYDYRVEWQNFTQTLTDSKQSAPQRVIVGISNLIGSTGGHLWIKTNDLHYDLEASNLNDIQTLIDSETINNWANFLSSKLWVIDINEYRTDRSGYTNLTIPDHLLKNEEYGLIVPLTLKSELFGFLLTNNPKVNQSINWEDRDLLKLAGAQAATLLAEYIADRELLEARQFDAFNKLSAYIVHELKNILGQQSLIVSNAVAHRDNPAFIDDVFNTIDNSVNRMHNMMEQLRSGETSLEANEISLNTIIQSVVNERSKQKPIPQLEICSKQPHVKANQEKLSLVFSHIIQNSQEATDSDGKVNINITSDTEFVTVEIFDTGEGMTNEFIKTRLFKPFETTKGLTGMGIGAYESKEYLRSINGNIHVESKPDIGSKFTIIIPVADNLFNE